MLHMLKAMVSLMGLMKELIRVLMLQYSKDDPASIQTQLVDIAENLELIPTQLEDFIRIAVNSEQ